MLVTDPIVPEGPEHLLSAPATPEHDELWRWAVFCVAAAEYLCDRYGVAHPAWIEHPAYTLNEPWYGFGMFKVLTPEYRTYLEQTTPEPLRRRNILGGDRVFANKYEFVEQVREMRHARSTRRL